MVPSVFRGQKPLTATQQPAHLGLDTRDEPRPICGPERLKTRAKAQQLAPDRVHHPGSHKNFPKRSCQGGGHRLRCSRSYERCGCQRERERGGDSSSAESVEAEKIFDGFFRRLKRRLFHLRKRRREELGAWQQSEASSEMVAEQMVQLVVRPLAGQFIEN